MGERNFLLPQNGRASEELVPLSSVETAPQIRKTINPDTVRELAENIKIQGLLHRVSVSRNFDGGLLLISGHRRLMACE